MKTFKNPLFTLVSLATVLVLLLAACVPGAPEPAPASDGQNDQGGVQHQEEPAPTEEPEKPTEEPTEELTEEAETGEEEEEQESPIFSTANEPLPPDPIPVTIITEDGRTLEGMYYPGAYNPGPVIVLMHWAGGTMYDWEVIGPWLQNRGLTPAGGGEAWKQPAWFPVLPEWASFGVLFFNFGGFGNSQGNWETGALDAKAAVIFASELEDVNPNLITTMGASIGADGAVDGCFLHQLAVEAGSASGICLGGLSLSPGNYLESALFEYTYSQAVEGLMNSTEAEKVVYCLAAEGDHESPGTCLSADMDFERYYTYIYPGSPHGMKLVVPDLFPINPALEMNTLEIYLMFLEEVYGISFAE
ncbi:alpha/beta hydrolase family protein [Chloroflexota bacterium]